MTALRASRREALRRRSNFSILVAKRRIFLMGFSKVFVLIIRLVLDLVNEIQNAL
jgi:hypothetical protein